jgi:hypothetical protein
MQVPSKLPGESLKGVADAKENCEKIEAAAEEMVGADTDAAFEYACKAHRHKIAAGVDRGGSCVAVQLEGVSRRRTGLARFLI